MIQIRPSDERGHAAHGWLDSRFTFSFDKYYNPEHMGFRSLRVINEDHVAPGQGFGMHPHQDMEILTYMLSGALEHRDSSGNRGVVRPGEIQKMSAGTGILHSEMNPSPKEEAHLLQIWLLPEKKGIKPEYEQVKFAPGELDGGFGLIAGRDGVVSIHQDAALYAAKLMTGEKAKHALAAGRHAWIQVARGAGKLNGKALVAGDGAAISDEKGLEFAASEASELLLFDLA
jgi:redox-sensitive bicupin YhaK (pirin superfamily)